MPGVGWIFTPRLPIRGPKSRAATAEKRAKRDPESAPAKAAELARAAKKAAKRTTKKAAPVVATTWPLIPTEPPPAPRGHPAPRSIPTCRVPSTKRWPKPWTRRNRPRWPR